MTKTLRAAVLAPALAFALALGTTTPAAGQSASAAGAQPPAAQVEGGAGEDLTGVYRVGAGDVLDIRLLGVPPPRRSTLYTVQEGGLLDFPLAGKPRLVAGLTTDEVAAHLSKSFRLRALYPKPPRVSVSVREYASHTITVGGLVEDPGIKVIQREAIPLYVVVADAQPSEKAGSVVVKRQSGGEDVVVDLADLAAMRTLVRPGDTVTVQEQTPQFIYIGGLVKEPGQKSFYPGLTLSQAIMQAGGALPVKAGAKDLKKLVTTDGVLGSRRSWYQVTVSRQDADGRLVKADYNLEEIRKGSVPDPVLRPGDRIVVAH